MVDEGAPAYMTFVEEEVSRGWCRGWGEVPLPI